MSSFEWMHIRRRPAPKKKGCNFVGGVVSPLLANIYLHELDTYMESTYLNLTKVQREKRRRHGQGNALYVRYCDDFVVFWNGTKAEAHAIKEELGGVLNTMGLTLSEEKTNVTHVTEGFDFLGYRVIRSRGTKGNMVPKVLIPEKAIDRCRKKIREMLAPSTTKESIGVHIAPCGRTLRTATLSSGAGSLRGWFIRAAFDHLHLVIDHPVDRMPDAPHPHLTPTVRTDQGVPTRALLIPLPVGQPGDDLHRALDHPLHLGHGLVNQDL